MVIKRGSSSPYSVLLVACDTSAVQDFQGQASSYLEVEFSCSVAVGVVEAYFGCRTCFVVQASSASFAAVQAIFKDLSCSEVGGGNRDVGVQARFRKSGLAV